MTKSSLNEKRNQITHLRRTTSAQFILAAACLTLSFASPEAQGHVHETYEACVARYGKPVEKRDRASVKPQTIDRLVHFEKGPYAVTIGFVADRAVSLVFSHTDGSPLRPDTVIDLLRENSGDAGAGFMGMGAPTVAGQKFVRSDHKAAALWARIQGKLLIWDTAYEPGEANARKEKSTSGF